MAARPTIALIVITRNEERLLGQCLRSAAFCDEKIVVDSFSTDRTVEIARAAGARVMQREFPGHLEQKQFALEQATADWVLSLDADEQLTHALRTEIEAVISAPAAADGYLIRRLLYHLGGYYSQALFPGYHLRLFRRTRGRFGGRNPHDKVLVEGRVAKLRAPLLHLSYRDVAAHVDSINALTSWATAQGEPDALTPLKMLVNPAWRFFNFYVLRGGFREGARGLYAAMAAAFYVFLKYAKLYERGLQSRRPR